MKIIKFVVFCIFATPAWCNNYIENIFFARDIPTSQYDVYEALIPKDVPGFKMPDQPRITVSMAMMRGQDYLEAQILMRVNYKGEDTYWGVYQPLNNNLGLITGLAIGFPKKMVDVCSVATPGRLMYNIDNCAAPLMQGIWEVDNQAKPLTTYVNEVEKRKGLMTVGRDDGCLKSNRTLFGNDPQGRRDFTKGYVKWTNNLNVWWADLIPSGRYASELVQIDYAKIGFESVDVDCAGYKVKTTVPGAQNMLPAPIVKARPALRPTAKPAPVVIKPAIVANARRTVPVEAEEATETKPKYPRWEKWLASLKAKEEAQPAPAPAPAPAPVEVVEQPKPKYPRWEKWLAENQVKQPVAVEKPVVNRNVNKALNKPVTASTTERCCDPAMLNDGNKQTSWLSWFINNQWIMIDLQSVESVAQVRIAWTGGGAVPGYATQYEVQVSTDKQNWQTVYTVDNGRGDNEKLEFAAVNARYVRLNLIKRAKLRGFGIEEIGIY